MMPNHIRRVVLVLVIFGCLAIHRSFAATTTLVSIAVTPPSASIAVGSNQQFSATGTYSNGSKKDITKSVNWSSTNTAVATVNKSGFAKGIAAGTATLNVSSAGISATAVLQVTQAVLTSIAVTPANASITAGSTLQFVATGKYSDGSTAVITNSVSWTSQSSVAAISNSGLAQGIAAGQTTISASLGTVTGQTSLTVTTPNLVSIVVSPANPSTPAGSKLQFTATGTYSDGSTNDLTAVVAWKSSTTAVATIDSAGFSTAVASGSTKITATTSRVTGSTTLTVVARTLQSIAITPANSSIPLGTTEQLSATGTYSDGSTQNLTSTVTWISSSASTASVSTTGVATSRQTGAVIITATLGSVSGQTNMTVTSAILSSISVTTGSASIPSGTTEQFTATGIFTDGTTQDLSASAVWASSVPSIAIIGASGLASAVAVGVTEISASFGSVQSNAVSLTVLPAVLQSIAVAPANSSIAAGLTTQFTATGTFSDGSTQDLTDSVTWRSDTTAVAVISSGGLATGVAVGTANVSATSNSISGSTILNVIPAQLVSIAITPAIPSIPLGTARQFAATGTYTDNSTQDLTATVHWSSLNPAVATISNSGGSYGLATSAATGTTTISASMDSVSGSTTLTVTPAELEFITVTPADTSIVAGTNLQFTAIGTYSDSTTMNLTGMAAWSSDTPTVATVDSTGLAQALSIGSAVIKATFEQVSGTTSLTVTSAPLVSIAVSPSAASIPLGTTQGFSATGNYADGSSRDLTASVHWSTSDFTIVTVSNAEGTYGLATSLAVGSVTVTATLGSISGTASMSVSSAALVSITLAPLNPSIPLGDSQQFAAIGNYSDGSTKDITANVTWTSSSAIVAVISNNNGSQGLATSSGEGVATVTAAMGDISAGTTLTVGLPQLISIAVSPADPLIPRGNQQQFTATGTYTDGSKADLTNSVVWSSSNSTVATISAGGNATGISAGNATITASVGSISGNTTATVTAPALINVIVYPANTSIVPGQSEQFAATAVYSDASTQDVTHLAIWTSSSPTIATINGNALATGVNYGTTTITAGYTGMNGMTTLTVQAPGLTGVTLSIDTGVPMDVGDANGTSLTITMLNNGTAASDCTVGGTGSTSCSWAKAGSAFSLAPSQSGCSNPGLIAINLGITYGVGDWSDHSIAFDAAQKVNTSQFLTPTPNIRNLSTLFCAVMGMSKTPGYNLFDMLVVGDQGGKYAVLPQLMTSCGGVSGNFGVNIEGKNTSGATVHSSCIPLTQGATYWFAGNYNTLLGTAALYVYTPTGALVGNVSLSNLQTGYAIYQVRVGNNETGTFTGTVYFQNLIFGWTNPASPLFW